MNFFAPLIYGTVLRRTWRDPDLLWEDSVAPQSDLTTLRTLGLGKSCTNEREIFKKNLVSYRTDRWACRVIISFCCFFWSVKISSLNCEAQLVWERVRSAVSVHSSHLAEQLGGTRSAYIAMNPLFGSNWPTTVGCYTPTCPCSISCCCSTWSRQIWRNTGKNSSSGCELLCVRTDWDGCNWDNYCLVPNFDRQQNNMRPECRGKTYSKHNII